MGNGIRSLRASVDHGKQDAASNCASTQRLPNARYGPYARDRGVEYVACVHAFQQLRLHRPVRRSQGLGSLRGSSIHHRWCAASDVRVTPSTFGQWQSPLAEAQCLWRRPRNVVLNIASQRFGSIVSSGEKAAHAIEAFF